MESHHMGDRAFEIGGMTCSACVRRVTEALKSVSGVQDATVTLHPPRAVIRTDQVATPASLDDALRSALRHAGAYTLSPLAPIAAPALAVQAPAAPAPAGTISGEAKPSFYPLLLVVGYICGVCAIAQLARGTWSWHGFMNDFMAGFFLVFSFFKLLDLRGFADAYRSYDIIARAWKPWGRIYPFLELALGVAYLGGWSPAATNIFTIALMLVGSVGVLRALLDKRAIRCACLGTAIKLPMTTVTLIEDLGMAAMAFAMLVLDASARA
ncbi:MAG: heavy-metal-associated domain-containing protein [Phycisphaerae bacterium]|nr:heavy-metal-associated domain-containing protein [Phycisphaerae bacterium]